MRSLTKTLNASLILIVVFCGSFYFFYKRTQKDSSKQNLILTSAIINQPLPKSNLVNISGVRLDDERLRRGKVVLVFMMPDCLPCDQENEFLKTVADSREDISFFYIIPFGNKDQVLELAQSKYAREPFYDNGSNLSRELQAYQVPIKIFLEDGTIKKVWLEATVDNQKQAEFKDWLKGL
jgi:hypothetical protein